MHSRLPTSRAASEEGSRPLMAGEAASVSRMMKSIGFSGEIGVARFGDMRQEGIQFLVGVEHSIPDQVVD